MKSPQFIPRLTPRLSRLKAFVLSLPFLLQTSLAHAEGTKGSLADQLSMIREQVSALEQGLLTAEHSRQGARLQIRKIQKLLKLQSMERELGQKRVLELENTVVALEVRQAALKEKMAFQQKAIRKCLTAIEASGRRAFSEQFQTLQLPEQEKVEAPRRKVLANLVDRGLKEVEALRIDLSDATQLEGRIQEEKQQLAYLFQDLREQESVLELNRQLQLDFLRKKQNERMTQLESYRKLKSAEAQVESMIGGFNARMELERSAEAERVVSKAMVQGQFYKLKGKLKYPIQGGKITSTFGRAYDRQSGLFVFKKGIDLTTDKNQPVRAIAAGKIAYSGSLPHYGQVVIIDHGDHFYSLCAHLGKVSKKTNEVVIEGDAVGITGDSGTPLYFEIRARNVAVNPLQWMFN